jgi:hypothetical protein
MFLPLQEQQLGTSQFLSAVIRGFMVTLFLSLLFHMKHIFTINKNMYNNTCVLFYDILTETGHEGP